MQRSMSVISPEGYDSLLYVQVRQLLGDDGLEALQTLLNACKVPGESCVSPSED
jgi:hypothetical protein